MPKANFPSPRRSIRQSNGHSFALLQKEWKLTSQEAAFLLDIEVAALDGVLSGDPPTNIDAEWHVRLGYCIDVANAVEVLEPGVDHAEWIRRPQSILNGKPPLYYLLLDEDCLRSIRWNLLCDAYPDFVGNRGARSAVRATSGETKRASVLTRVFRRLTDKRK